MKCSPLFFAILVAAVSCSNKSGTTGGSGSSTRSGAGGGSGSGGGTVAEGNGCAAGLGIDAGFYTCVREFFVSPSGSDANDGKSQATALNTIGAATKLTLKGGDCVTVAAGTYQENVVVAASGSAETCTGYVVFRAASQGAAKIVSDDMYHGVWVDADYVMVDGFDLHDTATGAAFAAGTNEMAGGHVIVHHHVAAIRNIAHDSGGSGLSALHADYIRFEANDVYGNAATSPYAESGINLWEAQASDQKPGFHIVVRNNASHENGNWNVANPSDGEGIILDTFDFADATYGTTPYHQDSLVENNVCWGNGGRGIEIAGAGPTSYVTVRNNTVFDDNRQQLPWPGAEIVGMGNHNEFYDNIAIVGPDAKDGPMNSGLTVALQDGCGTQMGVAVTSGSVWEGNIGFSLLPGNRLTQSSCPAPVSSTKNQLGVDPGLAAPSVSATSALAFAISPSSHAAHAGSAASYAPFDYVYKKRQTPPSVGAFEP
jgi:hypothetical protein